MNCIASILEFIEQLDYFFIIPSLNVFGKSKFKTKFGGFLTIIVATITLVYLISETISMLSKSQPNIIQSEQQVIETSVKQQFNQPFPLLINNFTIAIGISDKNSEPLTTLNTYFTINIQKCIRTRTTDETTQNVSVNLNCTTLETETCDTSNFVTEIQEEYFSKIRLGYTQCIKKDILIDDPPALQGLISGNNYQYLQITFSPCQNTSLSQNCASTEDIQEQLKTGFYYTHISDSLIQMNNPQDISQEIIKLQYTSFSISSSKTIYQYFRIIDAITDQGLVFEEFQNQQSLIQSKYQETSTFFNDDFIVQHFILLDSKLNKYNRTYIKLFTMLSRIGGLWQILFLFVGFILKPFVYASLQISIYNSLFRYDTQLINKIIFTQQVQQQQQFEGFPNSTSRTQKNSKRDELQNTVEKYHVKLKNSFCTTVLMTLGCYKLFKLRLDKAEFQYSQRADIINISKKLQEFDKLKYIILSDDQRTLFDLIPPPLIKSYQQIDVKEYEPTNNLHSIIFNQEKIEGIEKLEQGIKSFQNITLKQNEQNEIDNRIINYLDKETIQIFESYNENCIFNEIKLKKSQIVENEISNQMIYSNDSISPVPLQSIAAKVMVNQYKIKR